MTGKFTAYCGLYCKDCTPSKKELFETANKLSAMLDELQFDRYASLKAEKNRVFDGYRMGGERASIWESYPQFAAILLEIAKLECRAPCRAGGGKETCAARDCAVGKGYEGCWECDGSKSCELLTPLRSFHPCLDHNLEMIKKYGIDRWSNKRGKHYNWS